MFDLNTLGSNIKKYRQAKKLSQSVFAGMLGITPQSVSKWECGTSAPDVENLCNISRILGVSVDMLLEHCTEKKRLMIGVDGGGSKTEFLLFSEDGTIRERKKLGACNPNVVGTKGALEVLTTGINSLMGQTPGVCGIYIGAAGFMLGNHGETIRSELKKLYPFIKIKISSDLFNIAASALEDDRCCIAAISGTGSSVLVKDNEAVTRYSGYGYLLSRAGSGYDIGRDAIFSVLSHMDGMGKETALTPLIQERLGEAVSDIVEKTYKQNASFIASVAPLVFGAWRGGDEVATTILQSNAAALAEVIEHAHKCFPHIKTVVLSGSIITHNEDYQKLLLQQLSPKLKVSVPAAPPVIGACVLCARLCGVETEGLRKRLSEEYLKKEESLC